MTLIVWSLKFRVYFTLQHISVQVSHESSAQEVHVASGYHLGHMISQEDILMGSVQDRSLV